MANINFDDFEREIQQAESYLKSAGNNAPPETNSRQADSTQPELHEDTDTLYFASDLKSNPYDTYSTGEMHRYGLASSAPSSNKMYYADSEMDTMHFGATTDSLDDHNHDQNTLFYASDVVSSNPRQYQHGLETSRDEAEEEVLSFLPSPQITPRPDPSYDDSFRASMAETVRFTKPSEPALRSVDGNNYSYAGNSASGINTHVTAETASVLDRRQSSHAQNVSRNKPSSLHSKPRSVSASRSTTSRNKTPTRPDRAEAQQSPNKSTTAASRPSSTPAPVNKFVRQAYVPATCGPKKSTNAISMERIEELQRKRIVAKQEMLKKKRALDELQMAECTFRPQISKGTRSILHHKELFEQLDADCRLASDENATGNNQQESTGGPTEVSERLYREASIRSAQKNWINVQVQHLRDSQYTFQPMVNHNSGGPATSSQHREGNNVKVTNNNEANHALDRRPIHERVADMMKQKKQYLLALKSSVEQEQVDLTFHPRIDPRSRVMAEQKLCGYGSNANLPHANSPQRSSQENLTSRATSTSANSNQQQQQQQQHLTGEQQMGLVMGFHSDVGSRLIDQGRVIAKKKQQLAYERDNELAKAMEQVSICKGSAKIVQNADLKETFEERQAQYKQRERARQDAQLRERETVTNNWFKPQIDAKSAAIVHEQRPELSLESVEQRSRRLSVQDAQEQEARRQARAAEMYGAIPFTPAIDPLSRSLGRSSSIEELVQNRRALSAREKVRQRVEEETSLECTFKPKINHLSKQLLMPTEDELFLQKYNSEYAAVGWADQNCPLNGMEPNIRDSFTRAQNGRINWLEPEKMQRDIRMHALAKEEKRRSELIAREIQELRECTFHPAIESSFVSLEKQRQDTSPVVIRGLGRFLELKHLTARQKEEALQREREVFSVKNIDKYRRAEDGSTVVQSFNFNLTEPRQHSRLDISTGVEISPGSLNASTIMTHTSHRQPTSAAAAAAWCM